MLEVGQKNFYPIGRKEDSEAMHSVYQCLSLRRKYMILRKHHDYS